MYLPQAAFIERLERTFMHHPPDGNQAERYGQLRENTLAFAKIIATLTPGSREQALALTKLEECLMHANSAIARNERWDGGNLINDPSAGSEFIDRYQQVLDDAARSFADMRRDFTAVQSQLAALEQDYAALKASLPPLTPANPS